MEKSAKIMYLIGKILNIIAIVMMCIGALSGFIIMNNAQMIFEQLPAGTIEGGVEALKYLGQYLLIVALLEVVLYIVLIVLVSKAKKALVEGSTKQGIHIAMIVIGALFDLFYLLGGIFALVAIGSKQPAPQPASEEVIEVKEENKEE